MMFQYVSIWFKAPGNLPCLCGCGYHWRSQAAGGFSTLLYPSDVLEMRRKMVTRRCASVVFTFEVSMDCISRICINYMYSVYKSHVICLSENWAKLGSTHPMDLSSCSRLKRPVGGVPYFWTNLNSRNIVLQLAFASFFSGAITPCPCWCTACPAHNKDHPFRRGDMRPSA